MPRKPAPYHHGDLRRELLTRGRDHLRAVGLSRFSVAEVARAAGVSSAAPYRHFAGHDDLLAALAEQIGDELADDLAAAADDAGVDPVDRLAATAGAYTRFVLQHGAGLELVFSGAFVGSRFDGVHARSRRIMDVLLPLAHAATGDAGWHTSLDLLETHTALATGYATQQRNGTFATLRLTTDEVAARATLAARDMIVGFRARISARDGGDDSKGRPRSV